MKTTVVRTLALALCCTSFGVAVPSAFAQNIEWIEQFGTSSEDSSRGVSADGLGNVYILGLTRNLGGTNAGLTGAFVSKYDASGTLQWTEQLGTNGNGGGNGVSADGLGNVYISGGGTNGAYVSKYDASGNLQWTEHLGSNSNYTSNSVSADGLGNVYISGLAHGNPGGPSDGLTDAFVRKYDASGTLQWTEQLDSSSWDVSKGVSADGLGNVYISGFTQDNLVGPSDGLTDAFVRKYDASGTLQWTEQLGTSSWDESSGVSADGLGNVYISGFTNGNLGGTSVGNRDAFVSKYDASGTLQWTEQLVSSSWDQSFGVSADGWGNVYISGFTGAVLSDAFVSKYDASGNLLWTEQLGTSDTDISWGVSADGWGNVYISGTTYGNLGGTNAGGVDAFVAKLSDPIPEPSSVAIVLSAALGLASVGRRRLPC